MRWRFRLAVNDCDVKHRPETRHKLADEVYRLRRSGKELKFLDEEVPCFATEDSQGKDQKKPRHCSAVIVSWSSTKAETRTEHTVPRTVLNEDKKLVTEEPSTLRKFSQA